MTFQAEDLIVGLAANLARDLIAASARRFRDAAFGDSEQGDLSRAYQYAFTQMLTTAMSGLDPDSQAHVSELFQRFVADPFIANRLLDLALHPSEIPIEDLRESFDALGFDRRTLQADFDTLIKSFISGLASGLGLEAGRPNSPIFNRVNLARLTAMQILLEEHQQTSDEALTILRLLEKELRQISTKTTERVEDDLKCLVLRDDLNLLQQTIQQLPSGLRPLAKEVGKSIEAVYAASMAELRRKTLEDYLDALHNYSEQLPYITLPGKPLPLLSTIYIEQLPEEQKPMDDSARSTADIGQEPKRNVETIGQAIKHHRHLVLQGGPGIGKSTMLHHLALTLIETWRTGKGDLLVPIHVLARHFATRSGSLSGSLWEQAMFELAKLLHRGLPTDFFEQPPGLGARWLVMIDGVDEIVSQQARDELIQAILYHARKPDSYYHFVIATRPVPELDRFDRDLFGHYSVRPFEPSQVDDFAHKWFSNRPDANADDAREFLVQIKKSRIADLAQIPLLLTMAAVVYELDRNRTVPKHRMELYRQFVKILLEDEESVRETRQPFREEWDKRYGSDGQMWADRLFNQRRGLLEHLALWKQEGNPGSFIEESLRFIEHHGWIPLELEPEWLSRQIEIFLRRTGLLIWHGDRQGFIHNTFGEYLAASALARANFPDQSAGSAVIDRWSEDSWQEVVLLLLGIWGAEDLNIDNPIQHIQDIGGHEGLIFTGLALAEGVQMSPQVAAEIQENLLASARELTLADLPQHPNTLDVLSHLFERGAVLEEFELLTEDDTLNIYVREEGLRLMERRGFKTEATRSWYLLAESKTKNNSNNERALAALRRLGAVTELAAIGRNQKLTANFRLVAIRAMAQLGANEKVRDLLLTMVRDPELYAATRINAAKELAMMTQLKGGDEGRDSLFTLAREKGLASAARISAAKELALMSPLKVDDELRDLLLTMAKDTQLASAARINAANEVQKFLSAEDVPDMWLLLANDQSLKASSRLAVAQALTGIGLTEESNALLEKLIADSTLSVNIRTGVAKQLKEFRTPEDMKEIWMMLAGLKGLDASSQLYIGSQLMELGFESDSALLLLPLVHNSAVPANIRMSAAAAMQPCFSMGDMIRIWIGFAHEEGLGPQMRLRAASELQSLNLLGQSALILLSLVNDVAVKSEKRMKAALQLMEICGRETMAPIWFALAQDSSFDTRERLGIMAEIKKLYASKGVPPNQLERIRDPRYGIDVDLAAAGMVGQSNESGDRFGNWLALALTKDQTLRASLQDLPSKELNQVVDSGEPQTLSALALNPIVPLAIRIQAARALAESGSADQIADTWFALAYEPTLSVFERLRMVKELLRVKTLEEDAVGILASLIEDSSIAAGVRVQAINILGEFGKVQNLIAIINDLETDKVFRKQAVRVLEQMGNIEALAKLRHLANAHSEKEIRRLARHAVDRIGALNAAKSGRDKE